MDIAANYLTYNVFMFAYVVTTKLVRNRRMG
jgi:hypothetical protein